ncbi:MAG: dual specificity protein phosphatase family protein [Nitrososphaeraceae archaeon]|nr:dual specificity protein phosphatase family protein [Nitrososphaeraceae archaeon]
MAKIGNLFRWVYGHITGRTINFKWVIEDKLAGSGVPTSLREIKWLAKEHGIRSIVTIKEKPLPSEWFKSSGIGEGKIDYFHLSIEDYGAPSLEELYNVVNHISRQIDDGKRVMVHCSGGKGRTGTILAAYLIKKRIVLNAYQAIYKLRNIRGDSVQSKEQENVLFEYEKYLRSERPPPSAENNTTDIK